MKILFVCLGNICRSPMAEGVLRSELARRGLDGRVHIDSAGTGDWHIGEPPDPRARRAAADRGHDISALRGRQVTARDIAQHDLILAMDRENLRDLQALADPRHAHKLRLFLDFAPHRAEEEVPDPYYGGDEGFAYVLDLLEEAARGLADHLENALKARET